MYWFTPLKKVYQKEKMDRRTEEGNFKDHIGKLISRRMKLEYTKEAMEDTIQFLKQFKYKFKEKNLNPIETLYNAVVMSIEKTNKGIKCKSNWNRKLQPKLVNLMLTHTFNSITA